MNRDKQLLVENDLFWAVKVLCDTQDKTTRNKYIRKYVLEYCADYDIPVLETLSVLQTALDAENKLLQGEFGDEAVTFPKVRGIVLATKEIEPEGIDLSGSKEERENRIKAFIEDRLMKALSAFNDLGAGEARDKYVREYMLRFCAEHNIPLKQAIEIVKNDPSAKEKGFKNIDKIVLPKRSKNEEQVREWGI